MLAESRDMFDLGRFKMVATRFAKNGGKDDLLA